MRAAKPASLRRGLFEPLESRCLLAVDCQTDQDDVDLTLLTDGQAPLADDAITASDAGSTAGTAFNLGELGATRSLNGSVGGFDTADVMRFTVADESQVSIELGQLGRDIDLYLFDGSGQLLYVSNRGGNASESIATTLDSGTYYILVSPWRSARSTYVLTVGATPTAEVQPDPPTNNDPPNPGNDPPAETPLAQFPDVAYYGGSNEWNVNAVGAPESWAQGYTGEGVVVAVVDTGVEMNHPDLINQLWVNAGEIAGNGIDDDGNGYVDDVSGWDFASNDNNPHDGNGHGTHVAGTIAAEANGFGATGVAPDAAIMPVRVLGNNGSGTAFGVAAGIRYAAEMGADIINLSLGGGYSSVILAAIEYALQLDVLVVAAAGNESAGVPGYPARFSAGLSNVISVGAHTSSNGIAGFSNDVGGSGAVQVDAPGSGVYSTYTGGRYGRLSGTSMAAPHVAAVAALALSANSNLSATELRSLIVAGADRSISGSDALGGVNAAVTVARAAAGDVSGSSSVPGQGQPTTQGSFTARQFSPSFADAVVAQWSARAGAADNGVSTDSTHSSAIEPADSIAVAPRAHAADLVALAFADDGGPQVPSVTPAADSIAAGALDDIFSDRLLDWLDAPAAVLLV